MRLIDFEPRHAEVLVKEGLNTNAPPVANDYTVWANKLIHNGMAFTGVENGHLVGAAGLAPLWEGVAEGWFLGGWRLHDNKFAAIRIIRRELDRMVKENNLHRLQCVVRTDWPEAQKFIEFLGWESEGVMKKYTFDKIDYIRYAKVSG